MKNIMSYLIVIFSLFGTQLAQASDCNALDLPVKLADLKFLEVPFTTLLAKIGKSAKCDVVKIKGWQSGQTVNQKQGTTACRAEVGRTYAINPGNPQYGQANLGHLLDNKLGYFFCMPGANKQLLCNQMERDLKSSMDVTWDPRTASGDGDCLCKRKGDNASAFVSCPADPSSLQTENSLECLNPLSQKEGDKCVCSYDKTIVVRALTDVCPGAPQAQETATVSDTDLAECFTEIKGAQDACSEKGQAAINKCSKDAPEVNKNISEAQRVLSIGLDAIVAKNAGTGALEACAKMSAAGTSVIEALSFLRENCKKELEGCKKGCDDVKAYSQKSDQDYINECKTKFEAKYPAPAGKTWTPHHERRVVELAAQYKSSANNAEKFCKGDVEVADNQLENFVGRLGESVQMADICKCQLTASSVNSGLTKADNCEAINSPLTCMQNINQPGCSYSSVGCTPGSTIAGCRNPISAVNPNGSGVAKPASGFAGPGFGSGGGGAGAGGKVGVNAGDLSGLYDETRPSGSGTATADAGSPFGVAAGGGGGGGSGGGGGGGSGEGGGAAGEEKKEGGISGLFQSTKNGIASLFGGGADNKGSSAKKPDNKAYKNDVNGFRPKSTVRGMANANEFGSKNRDIWKTMNERYNDQYHTFITVESPSK